MNTLRVIAAMLGVVVAAGCASRPTEPDPLQAWLSLDEYKAALASGTSSLVSPVVTLPPGAVLELRMSRKPMEFIEEDVDHLLLDTFEPVDDPMMSVRLRTRKTVYLDLQHLLASGDKKSWAPIHFYFFPLARASSLSVNTGGPTPDVTVPLAAFFHQTTILRDPLGEIKSK